MTRDPSNEQTTTQNPAAPLASDGNVTPVDRLAIERAAPTVHRLAAVEAVLVPLCNVPCVAFPPALDTVQALRALWRYRILVLDDAGWKQVKPSETHGNAFSCPCRAFAQDPSAMHRCGLKRVCPFCYAIQVALRYENVRRAMQRYQKPLDLYLLVRTTDDALDQLRDAVAMGRTYHHQIKAGNSNVGGIVTRTTVSLSRGRTDRIQVRRAALVALPRGSPSPTAGADTTVRPYGQDDIDLALAVAELSRYPTGLLGEDPAVTALILNTLGNRWMGNTIGLFRLSGSVTSLNQIVDQPLVPARQPQMHPWQIAEYDDLVLAMSENEAVLERHALHGLLRCLGLSTNIATFAEAKQLPLPVDWLGRSTLTMNDLLTPRADFTERVRLHQHEVHFALVQLVDGRLLAASTLPDALLSPVPGTVSSVTVEGRCMIWEALPQFAARLRAYVASRSGSPGADEIATSPSAGTEHKDTAESSIGR